MIVDKIALHTIKSLLANMVHNIRDVKSESVINTPVAEHELLLLAISSKFKLVTSNVVWDDIL